ncbi:MAG TPA: tetratricopeptide repeat protein [Terracidiphilus sp.]
MCVARFAGLAFSLLLAGSRCTAQAATPPVVAAQRQTALSLEQQGSYPAAEQAWHAVLNSNPRYAEAYAHLGLIAARQENYKEAIPLYRKALALGPDLPGVHLNLGLALFKGGYPKEAIPEFAHVLKSPDATKDDAFRARLLIGMAHYGQGEYAEAVPFLKQAAASDAGNLSVRLVLAHSCLWSKQNQCVLDIYKEILAINPESAEADMLAGEALDGMKDNDGATKMFRAAVAANPKEPNVHFGLGYLLWTQKQYPEAASEFQAELANDPQHAQAMLYLGDALVQLDKPADARPLLARAIAIDPTLWLGQLDLGIIDSDAGRNDDALRELQSAESQKQDDVNIHWRLARLYRALGRKDEAKAEFDKASKLNKAADDDLFKKISGGQQKPPADAGAPQQSAPAPAAPQ